jgi:hypothetical protein
MAETPHECHHVARHHAFRGLRVAGASGGSVDWP